MSEYICPQCHKPIHDEEALLCHFCGGSLNRPIGFLGKIKSASLKTVFIFIVVLMLASFILSMI